MARNPQTRYYTTLKEEDPDRLHHIAVAGGHALHAKYGNKTPWLARAQVLATAASAAAAARRRAEKAAAPVERNAQVEP